MKEEIAKIIASVYSDRDDPPVLQKDLDAAQNILDILDLKQQDACYLCKHPSERETY